ncbi:O-Antigen ligase [compost metagenome]
MRIPLPRTATLLTVKFTHLSTAILFLILAVIPFGFLDFSRLLGLGVSLRLLELSTLCVLLYLAWDTLSTRRGLKFNRQIVLWGVFLAYAVASSLFNNVVQPYADGGTVSVLIKLLEVSLLALFLANHTSSQNMSTMLKFLVHASLLLAFQSLITFAMSPMEFTRIAAYSLGTGMGFADDQEQASFNEVGALFAVMYILAFAFMTQATRWRKVKYGLMTVAFLVSALLTMSRSAILALLAMTVIYLYMSRKMHYLLFLLLPMIPLAVYNYSLLEPLFELLTNRIILSFDASSSDNLSILDRMDAWRHGLEVFLNHPFIGVGYAGYPHFTTSAILTPESYYIEILADLGLVGFTLFMLVIINGLYKYWHLYKTSRRAKDRASSNMHAVLFTVIIGLLLGNITGNNFFDPSLLLLFLLITTMAFNVAPSPKALPTETLPRDCTEEGV